MTFSEEVKTELRNKVEVLQLKRKRDMVELAMKNGTDIVVPFSGSKKDKRVMIKGAFLGVGQISNPNKSYHIEFRCKTIEHARFVILLLNDFDIDGKYIKREKIYSVYLKKSDDIISLLNIMGAHKALFEMQDIKILNEINNTVNRQVNFDSANMSKIAKASAKQVMDIKIIDKYKGLENIEDDLREVAILRLENPDCSFEEIGRMLKIPISKSGVNHRFRKLRQIAKEYDNE